MKVIKKIQDAVTGNNVGFITEYPDNEYIARTVVYGHETSEQGEVITQGNITVIMRNGDQFTFECMADTSYCGQFGITVSNDGSNVYVISSDVGLWCYTYRGELKWKTRYTSIGHVIENDDRTVTCIASTKLLQFNENGQKIKERKIVAYHASRASKNMIYAALSENTRALIDSASLEDLWKCSIKKLGLESSRYALIYDHYLIINGQKPNGRIVYIPIEISRDICDKSRYDETIASEYGFNSYFKRPEFKEFISLKS